MEAANLLYGRLTYIGGFSAAEAMGIGLPRDVRNLQNISWVAVLRPR